MRASTLQYALVLALLGGLLTVRGRAVLSDRADVSYDADAPGACPRDVKCLPVTDYLETDFDGTILPILPRIGGSGGHEGGGGHDDGSGDGDSGPGSAAGAGDGDSSGGQGGGSAGGDGGPKNNPWDADDRGGSPDSTTSKGSQSSSDEDFPQGPASQAPIDIVARGYSSLASGKDINGRLSVEISTANVGGPLDELDLDLKLDSIGVEFAQNRVDKIEDNPGKVPLRTILTDTWRRHSGKQMSDLKSVNYQAVVEEQMKAAIPKAYQAAGRDFNEGAPASLTVLRDADPQSAYGILMNTPFGGGAQKMLAETAGLEGRTIDTIDLFPAPLIDVRFNF